VHRPVDNVLLIIHSNLGTAWRHQGNLDPTHQDVATADPNVTVSDAVRPARLTQLPPAWADQIANAFQRMMAIPHQSYRVAGRDAALT